MLVGMFLFCVIYAAVFTVLALCRARDTRKNNREQEYTPVYRKPIDKNE
jgi:DMSO/TMAO reductase YedYZ heme-binding membrane subunit